MSESRRIVALSHRARARGDQLCLATVVLVEGSAYRKPGARMLVTSGGERAGTISGGCLESEVSRKAWWHTRNGAHIERYSSFAEEDGSVPYGLGCGGTVSLLLEQGEPVEAVLAAMDRVLTTRQPAVVVTGLGEGAGGLSRDGAGPSNREARTVEPPHAGTLAVLGLASPGASRPGLMDPSPELFDSPVPGAWEVLYLRPDGRLSQSHSSHRSNSGNGSNAVDKSMESGASNGSNAKQAALTLHPGLASAVRLAASQRLSCLLDNRFLPCSAGSPGSSCAADAPAYFVEYLAPPPAVTIFGAGDDAQPLAELAHTLGWRVTIADGRAHLARRERFPQADEVRVLDYADPALRVACGMPREKAPPGDSSSTTPRPATSASHPVQAQADALLPALLGEDELAVILTHSYEQDRALLAALLPRPLRYLGILGPRHRTDRLLSEVAPALGLSIEQGFARLHSPIGLDLGAGDPAAVALSIVAEIQAVLQGREVHVGRVGEPLALLLAGN